MTTDLVNMADKYEPYLNNMKYGDSYNMKVHSAQTALNILGYGETENVNLNTMRYGYYDVNTDNMVSQFQKEHNLTITGQLDERTWDGIFASLLDQKNCVVAQTATSQISIIDIDTYIESLNNNNKQYIGLDNSQTLGSGSNYDNTGSSKSNSAFSYPPFDNDLLADDVKEYVHNNLDTLNPGFSKTYFDTAYNENGERTDKWAGAYQLYGSEVWDNLVYNYIVNGGTYYNGMSYSYNLNGPNYWNETVTTPVYNGTSDKDYDFIYNLLANSLVSPGIGYDGEPLRTSKSATNTLKDYDGSYDNSTNAPFFSPSNIKQLRRSRFDLTIVYGAKGETARKLLDLTPIAVTQEMNASGEPIYDVYEFVARDVVYSNNQ
jgi:hypothetical protein